jgi:hypothetical protein
VREIADDPLPSGKPDFRTVHAAMRKFQEALESSKLVEYLHRRGMDSVASEVAEEISVLFEHSHLAPSPREQQSSHHARGPAANDDEIGSDHEL